MSKATCVWSLFVAYLMFVDSLKFRGEVQLNLFISVLKIISSANKETNNNHR